MLALHVRVEKIKVTSVDWESEHLRLVQKGVIDLLVGQKRELFTWYGAQFLFDMVHDANMLSENDDKAGITNIPYSINTGLIKITKENIAQFIGVNIILRSMNARGLPFPRTYPALSC
jgi:hypothetical protein